MTDCQRLIPLCLDFFNSVEIRDREGKGEEVLLLLLLWLPEVSFNSSKRNWITWERGEEGGREREREREREGENRK